MGFINDIEKHKSEGFMFKFIDLLNLFDRYDVSITAGFISDGHIINFKMDDYILVDKIHIVIGEADDLELIILVETPNDLVEVPLGLSIGDKTKVKLFIKELLGMDIH